MGEYLHFTGVVKTAEGKWRELDEVVEKRIDEFHQIFKGKDGVFDPIVPIVGWPIEMGFEPCEQDYYHSYFDTADMLVFDFSKPMTKAGQPLDRTWADYIVDTVGYDTVEDFLMDVVAPLVAVGASRILTHFDN